MKKKISEKKTAQKRAETFGLFFSCALYGLVFFRFYLTHYNLTVAYTAHTYFHLFAWGWIISVGSGTALSFLWKFIREKLFPKESCLYSVLAFCNLAYVFYIYLPSQWDKPGLLKSFLIFQLLWAAGARLLDAIGPLSLKTNVLYFFMMALALGWLNMLFPGWYRVDDWNRFNYLFFATIFGFLVFGIRPSADNPQPYWAFQGLNIPKNILSYLLAFILIGSSINTFFNYDPHHYSFYLGPVTDLAGGKSLLVNIHSQYGIFVIYFLRIFFYFLPMGYISFSLVLALLTGAQYFLFFFVVRKIFQSEILAFFSLIVLLMINHLAQENAGILFPSVGALRFGFIYVLMALIVVRNQRPQKTNLILWVESVVVGIAFFWSLEVCVYVVLSYFGLLIYECVDFKNNFKPDFHAFLKRSGMLGICLVVFAALLYMDVFRRTGEWPNWNFYFDYLNTYGNGYDMLPLPPLGYWWLVTCLFYFSLFAIIGILLGKKEKFIPANLNVMIILTFCGILQFTYYFRRAHTMNLYHVSMPAILLGIYWIYFVRRYNPPSMPIILKKLGYGAVALLTGFFLQKPANLAIQKLNFQPVSVMPMIGRVLTLPAKLHNADTFILQAAGLMDKYSGNTKSVVYFLGNAGFEISMYSGRINRYPYNDIVQPTLSPLAMTQILSFDPHIKPGEYIYASSPDGFEKKLFDGITSRFDLDLVEQANGISVYKVAGEKAAT